jgi:hypothetical protein
MSSREAQLNTIEGKSLHDEVREFEIELINLA